MNQALSFGNFEKLAQKYSEGRYGFDDKVFDYISETAGTLPNKYILDIGCGTGLGTRQLKSHKANVVGSDISAAMIEEARTLDSEGEYVVAPVSKLPFPDNSFDMVTAFSSFHWFTDQDSINEIKRILKPGGAFYVINKNDISGIRKDVSELFKNYKKVKGSKENYEPEKIMVDSNFLNVTQKVLRGVEIFPYDKGLSYLKSIALWNLVPDDDKNLMDTTVKDFCAQFLLKHGQMKREIETKVVLGFN